MLSCSRWGFHHDVTAVHFLGVPVDMTEVVLLFLEELL